MTAERFNDDALGRVLDRIHEYGTWKLFSEISLVAFRNFTVDCSVVHQDTTSVSVWGDYEASPRDPLTITHGFSKDQRPDLKQFILSLLFKMRRRAKVKQSFFQRFIPSAAPISSSPGTISSVNQS